MLGAVAHIDPFSDPLKKLRDIIQYVSLLI